MPALPLAIRAEGLWKTYRIHPPGTPRRLLHHPTVEFHALRDVSFEVPEGAVLGIVGHNGAGKSTLLKVLSRITDPSRGLVRVAGRVASLLEVGTGFHPELTGLENLYLNAAIHGLKRHEVHLRLESILAFAEIGDFLHEPVKHYSSGMYLRLAFSVAAHLDPEILIVDELLAVGDAAFRERCLGKMRDVAGSGRTVIVVSHDLSVIRGLCSHAMRLERGAVMEVGSTEGVVSAYVAALSTGRGQVHLDKHSLQFEELSARYERVGVGRSRMCAELSVVALAELRDLTLDFMLTGPSGARLLHIMGSCTKEPMVSLRRGERGRFHLRCALPELAPGQYLGEVYMEARGWEGQLYVSGLRLFDVGPDRPESLAANFTAVQLPPHVVRVDVEV